MRFLSCVIDNLLCYVLVKAQSSICNRRRGQAVLSNINISERHTIIVPECIIPAGFTLAITKTTPDSSSQDTTQPNSHIDSPAMARSQLWPMPDTPAMVRNSRTASWDMAFSQLSNLMTRDMEPVHITQPVTRVSNQASQWDRLHIILQAMPKMSNSELPQAAHTGGMPT